ncbi:MAG: hypothetical protein SF339_22975 [Blastocatellia bacterium]|nr:hypothetical protein [Blastocatellia bacterium]
MFIVPKKTPPQIAKAKTVNVVKFFFIICNNPSENRLSLPSSRVLLRRGLCIATFDDSSHEGTTRRKNPRTAIETCRHSMENPGGMGGLVLSLLVNALPDLFASNEPERANMSYQE